MSSHNEPLMIVVLLVALAAAGWLLAQSLKVRQEEAKASGAPPEGGSDPHPMAAKPGEELLLKFVADGDGTRRGETVAVEEGKLILKNGPDFFAAPLESFEDAGDEVKVVGPVDWEAAKAEGEAWRDRSHKPVDYDESELPPDEAPGKDSG